MREAVAMLARGAFDLSLLLTHRFPLDRLGDALDATRDRPDGFMKAWVAP
jgi:threonine dehydrogenase-like Zn-dependent dehydrogenase